MLQHVKGYQKSIALIKTGRLSIWFFFILQEIYFLPQIAPPVTGNAVCYVYNFTILGGDVRVT